MRGLKIVTIGVAGVLLTACAASKNSGGRDAVASGAGGYDDAVQASALCFDPPVAQNNDPIDLDRDSRAASAFLGYDGPTVEHVYIFTDDRQVGGLGSDAYGSCNSYGSGDRYERRAFIERTGTRVR